jgi:hypothetical protein
MPRLSPAGPEQAKGREGGRGEKDNFCLKKHKAYTISILLNSKHHKINQIQQHEMYKHVPISYSGIYFCNNNYLPYI